MAVGVMGGLVCPQADGREFASRNGSTMEAELVSHKEGKVTIRRDDGKDFEVEPSIFCQKDEDFIRKWMSTRPETVIYNFAIEADKKKVDGEKRNYGYKTVKNELWSYQIRISNNSKDTVSDLEIHYRVFYTNSADGSYGTSDDSPMKMVEGAEKLRQELEYNNDILLTTRAVPIDMVDYRYGGSRYKDELKGCLVRILDPQGEVVCDWVSPAVSMKGKTWENTGPKSVREGGSINVIR